MNYKDNDFYAGYSDIARVMYEAPEEAGSIYFGGDGDYDIHTIPNVSECPVPDHYEPYKVLWRPSWVTIRDDKETVTELLMVDKYQSVIIYRAGELGCLITNATEGLTVKWSIAMHTSSKKGCVNTLQQLLMTQKINASNTAKITISILCK